MFQIKNTIITNYKMHYELIELDDIKYTWIETETERCEILQIFTYG